MTKTKKTVVRFDFARSKEVTDYLNRYARSDGIRGFTDIIEELWTKALPKEIQKNEVFIRAEGDGAYLMFDNADNAHNFAIKLHCNEEKWLFCIGAA